VSFLSFLHGPDRDHGPWTGISSRSPPAAVAGTVGGPGPRTTTLSGPLERKKSAHLVSTHPLPHNGTAPAAGVATRKKSEGGRDLVIRRPEYYRSSLYPRTNVRFHSSHSARLCWRRLEYRHRPMKSWYPHTKLGNRLARVTASQMPDQRAPPPTALYSAAVEGQLVWCCPDPLPTRH
jgi:hypothetical protein